VELQNIFMRFFEGFFRVFQGGINVAIRTRADAPWRVPTTFDARRFDEKNDARRFDKNDARRFGEKPTFVLLYQNGYLTL
jgi:hypothetical protein